MASIPYNHINSIHNRKLKSVHNYTFSTLKTIYLCFLLLIPASNIELLHFIADFPLIAIPWTISIDRMKRNFSLLYWCMRCFRIILLDCQLLLSRASTRIFARGCRDIARGCTRRAFGAQRAPLGFAPRKNLKKWCNLVHSEWCLMNQWGVKICFKNDWIMKIFFFIIVFLKNLINILLFYFFRLLGVAKFATICRRCIQCRDGKNKSSAVWSTHTYYIQIMTSHNYLALTWHTET